MSKLFNLLDPQFPLIIIISEMAITILTSQIDMWNNGNNI